jgi:hypothetical protein
MSINFDKIEHYYVTGKTSATANETAPSKSIIPDEVKKSFRTHILAYGEGVYLEGADAERDGINFPSAVVEISDTAPSSSKIVRLTDTLYVAAHLQADNALKTYAGTLSGTTMQWGDAATVNSVDTDSIDLCRVSDSIYAIAYRDEGGDDYLCVRAGSISARTITQGTEKELTATAIIEDELGITYDSGSGCIIVAYADGDDDLATIACPLSTITFGTPGAVVEFDAAAPSDVSICMMRPNYFFVVYADGGDANKMHGRVASVSAAGAIGTPGTEKTIINAAGTFMIAKQLEVNKVAIGYIDASADPSVVVCTTTGAAGTTITAGMAVAIAAATATDVGFDLIDNQQGIITWCDDAHSSDVGYATRFSVATTTVTADSTPDKFVDASAKGGTLPKMGCACSRAGKCVVIYNDADNDLASIAGMYYEDRIIDIRSTAASATYKALILPVHQYETTS